MAVHAHPFLSPEVRQGGSNRLRSPLYGIWIVDDFSVAGISPRPLLTDKLASDLNVEPGGDRWSELIFDAPSVLTIHLSNGVLDYTSIVINQINNTVSVSDEADPNWKSDFAYQRTGDQLLSLQGNINGNAVALKLHRLSQSNNRLTSRGFHWINEFPF